MNEIPPTPSGDALVVRLLCTDGPSDETGEERFVTILDDWTVYAPGLDIEADAVARALGGWSSLLHFVESSVPAFRHALQVMWNPASLGRSGGRWTNTRGGCRQTEHLHVSLKNAVRHAISTDHAAFLFESREWQVPGVQIAAWNQYFDLLWQAREVWIEDASRSGTISLDEALMLWRAGLLPHREVERVESPLGSGVPVPLAHTIERYFNALDNAKAVERR